MSELLSPRNEIEHQQKPLEEIDLPGAGSFELLLLRHSAFIKKKIPQIVNADGKAVGDAKIHKGPTKKAGYYDSLGATATGESLEIPGISTEQGLQETFDVGIALAESLKSDGTPTYVKIVSSPSRWLNEKFAKEDVPHEFGNRSMYTALAFQKGLKEGLQNKPKNEFIIETDIENEESLSESGYFYNEREGLFPSSVAVAAKDLSERTGEDIDPKHVFVKNPPEIQKLAKEVGTRTAEEIANDITAMTDGYKAKYQNYLDRGYRVILVGVTHSMDMRSFVMHAIGDEKTALQKAGYRDSEILLFERTEDQQHNSRYNLLGYTDIK